jgi:hypothetical protein
MAQMKGIRSDEKRVAPLGGGLALRGGVNLSAYEYNSCKYTAVTTVKLTKSLLMTSIVSLGVGS